MSRPFTLLQLSDPHLGATWATGDTVDLLSWTVEWIARQELKPDAVLVSGDLADHATDEEYAHVRQLLEPLAAPIYALPGNHDERSTLRRHFDLPGVSDQPVDYVVGLGPLRLVVLDSTRPGDDGGELTRQQLFWLNETLVADRSTPTVVAMHHPPLVTEMPAWDRILFSSADRIALNKIVRRHPQVRRIVAGHLHRPLTGTFAGCGVLVAPSTYVQFKPVFGADTLMPTEEGPGFAVHALVDGEVVSYVQTLP